MTEKNQADDCTAHCPQCGTLCKCYHSEIGTRRWWDRYGLHCPSCKCTFYQEIDGGEPDQPSELPETLCPFCGVSCHKHRPIPKDASRFIYYGKELHGHIPSDELIAIVCPKCQSPVTCAYQGDLGGADYSWTWLHKCSNEKCDYQKQFSNCACAGQSSGPDDSGTCPGCGNRGSQAVVEDTGQVCVRVDCKCTYGKDWLYYPKDIIGLHRINTNDPRTVIGRDWDTDGACKGHYYSQGCEAEDCNHAGTVVELFNDCAKCPHMPECTFIAAKRL